MNENMNRILTLDKTREEYQHFALYISAQLFRFSDDCLVDEGLDFNSYVSEKDADDFRSVIENYTNAIEAVASELPDCEKRTEALTVIDYIKKNTKATFINIEELRNWEED